MSRNLGRLVLVSRGGSILEFGYIKTRVVSTNITMIPMLGTLTYTVVDIPSLCLVEN
jgi:hypothetical protein